MTMVMLIHDDVELDCQNISDFKAQRENKEHANQQPYVMQLPHSYCKHS